MYGLANRSVVMVESRFFPLCFVNARFAFEIDSAGLLHVALGRLRRS